ncbi:hypothetical protein [Halorussus halophilus]|uniref:hypothetical protein n=1 Tax=Halorussus halophilus TaxID=2650975 RepID=UPI001301370E|nr:hypothetical protein [Halorussus halophilus]
MAQELTEEQKAAVREQVQEHVQKEKEAVVQAVREHKKEQLPSRISTLLEDVLIGLNERGIDIHQEEVDVVEIARDTVMEAVLGSEFQEETPDTPVSSRDNRDIATEDASDTKLEPETYTEEIPLERGEDPETVEIERVEPPTDPRLNADLNASEISWAYKEGVLPDRILGKPRTNEDDTSTSEEESDPEDVPRAGLPWYQ